MKDEIVALEENGTWDLEPLTEGKTVVDYKWVYTLKLNPDGSLVRLKACLVAKGYSHTCGVDYHATFSPMTKMMSIRNCK